MKTRIIFAAAGIPLLLAVIFFLPLPAFGLVVAAISALSALELLRNSLPGLKRRFIVYAMISSAVIPLVTSLRIQAAVFAAPFMLTLVMFCEMMASLKDEETALSFESVTSVLFSGAVLPLMLSALIRLGAQSGPDAGIMLPILAAFASDSGAYFVGVFRGRHSLAPHVSPSKTIEGSVGGFLCTIIVMLAYGLILRAAGYTVRLPVLAIYGFLGSLACQIGDLSFSAIKRVYGVKDYGALLPGHGGVLDRFDGMHFTAPMIELLALWVPAVIGLPPVI